MIDRHHYAKTFGGLGGQPRGLPKKLKKSGEDLQTLRILHGSPSVISTSINLAKARSMNVLLKQGKKGRWP